MTDALRMGDVVNLREDDSVSPVGTLYGYFARFNEPTEINNPVEGHFIERIAPGAFTKTLQERGRSIPVLFHHGLDPAIGMRPLGVPSVVRQEDTGVYAEVPLDDTSYNRDLAASLRSGALGQSFRFRPITARDTWTKAADGMPEVTRGEVVLREFGPTPIPAYSGASAAIRSGDVPDLLVPSGGISLARFLVETTGDLELEAMFPEIRAGAVLSAANLDLVDKAIEALTALKAAADRTDAIEDDPARSDADEEDPAAPDEVVQEHHRAELLLALTQMRRAALSI